MTEVRILREELQIEQQRNRIIQEQQEELKEMVRREM
jgi:hypothetical protein